MSFLCSQAVQVNETLYVSGQLGMTPSTMELANGAEAQARLALENLGQILAAAGTQYSNGNIYF